ncbi:MAG: 50S ribosomal protein L25 [candidate division WOR-3 bacterium]|nr:MAG: 50S ribosomal protein L25 [candidate division WOR-3 bacterium]
MKIDLQTTPFKAEKKGDLKRLRRQGKIPAVLYGHKEKTRNIYIDMKEFKKILDRLQQETVTVNLKLEKKNYLCVIKTIQHDPTTGELLHIDFQHIHKKERIRTAVPIHAIGEAPGVKKGGILDQHLHEIVVRCLPDEMPSHIDVDISQLELGQSIHLKDIALPNVEFELNPETTVVSVLVPRAVEVAPQAEVPEEVKVEGEEGVEEGVEEKEKEKERKEEAKESEKTEPKEK